MMRFFAAPLALGVLLVSSCASAPSQTPQAQRIVYPETRTVDQVDTQFGVAVVDPYRWLEQDVRTAPDVAQWVEAQNTVTRSYLDALPERAPIEARLRELWTYDRYAIPRIRGSRVFYEMQRGDQNQAALYVQEGMEGQARLLLDPNTWSQDGATNIAAYEPSPDGAHVVYAIQDSGSDWRILRVLDVTTGAQLQDEVRWVKFSSLEWAPDGRSFFYARYPEPPAGQMFTALNFNHAIYRHVLGTPQSADTLVYSRPAQPRQNFSAEVADDDRTLVITVSQGTDARYEIVLIDLAGRGEPQLLIGGFENDYDLVGQDGGRLLFLTNRNAPRGRIVSIDPRRPQEANWREIIAQGEAVLTDADNVGGMIVAEYLRDAKSEVRRFQLNGALAGEIELPGLGSSQGFDGGGHDARTFYSFASFNRPDTIYSYDTSTGQSAVFRAPEVDFNPDDYVVTQEFYASRDGTRVPMFIVHRRDVTPNGARPSLLYAYGGFNAAQLPIFQPQRLQWLEMGGVFVLANIRGGSEYGAEWHDGGRLLNKQNGFDDFIAAGEHLIASRWTSREHLAIQGRSNGGLLVGAVLNQRPDLFAAALPQVGVMDMLRYTQFSAGRFWTDDYGDPAEETHFRNIYAYSPYHNIRDGVDYPAMLITTADTDDRVVPGHSFKYAARMQAAQAGATEPGDNPRLIRIQTRAGHGSGRSTDQLVAEFADMWAFIAHHTGLQPTEETRGN
jgi:prolyl oligopeptidase